MSVEKTKTEGRSDGRWPHPEGCSGLHCCYCHARGGRGKRGRREEVKGPAEVVETQRRESLRGQEARRRVCCGREKDGRQHKQAVMMEDAGVVWYHGG